MAPELSQHGARRHDPDRDRLSLALRAANVGVWDWDILTGALHLSPEFKRQIGYDDHEIANDIEEWRSRLHPDDLDATIGGIRAFVADPHAEEFSVEFRFRHRDGSWRHMLAQASAVRDPGGRATRAVGVHVDMTELRRAEAARREDEAHRQLALDAAGLGTWRRDLASGDLVLDARAQLHYGLASPTTLEALLERIHADDRAGVKSGVEAALAPGGSGRFAFEYRIYHADGALRWLAVNGAVINGDGDTSRGPVAVIGASQDITERKALEETARRTASTFIRAFEASPAPLVITQAPGGRIVELNTRFERLSGVPRSEAVGHDVVELGLVPADVARRFRGAVIAGRPERDVEIDLASRTGTKRVRVTMEPLDLEGGLHTLVLLQDVTELRSAERALASSEERLRLALEAAHLGTWDMDLATGTSVWSPRFRDIVGVSPDAPPDRDLVRARIHPEHLAEANRLLARATDPSTDGRFSAEYRIAALDGTERWVAAHGRAVFEGDGDARRAVRVLGTLRDITAQKAAEEALVRMNERFVLAARAASLGVWDWDITSNTLEWDDRMYGLYGVQRGQFPGAYEAWLAGVHPDDRERSDLESRRALSGEAPYDTEFRVVWPDGTVRHLRALGAVTRAPDGRPVRMIGVNEDITDRKHAEQQVLELNATLERRVAERTAELTAANAELEAFSYSVSHDLRAPLRSIDGFARIIAEQHAERLDETARGYLGRVTAAAERMGRLIDDLLDLARLARAGFSRRPTDVTAIAREILDRLHQIEPRRQVRVIVADGLVMNADPRLLAVALENLIGNAWKFTSLRDVAHIEVGRTPVEGASSCFVRDDGAGFDMKYAHKLFAPFQRLHRATEFPGTGIGLAIVQRIVQRHGGRAWVEAELDRGATFHFSIPD